MTFSRQIRVVAAAVLVLGAWSGVHAEVSTDVAAGPLVNTLIMGATTEDPDPIGVSVWLEYRSLPPERILNAGGYLRGDGRPDLTATSDGWPVAAWAQVAGGDHDIALAEWSGSEWGPTQFLTFGPVDDLDPRLFVEPDGTVHLVWWTDTPTDAVYLATRPAGSSVWGSAIHVSDPSESSRRPSMVIHAGSMRVAYERDSTVPGMAQDVVVASREANDSLSRETIASTTRSARLDPMLHARDARLWLDWKYDNQTFNCTEYFAGAWDGVSSVPWADSTWIGVETVRKAIAGQIP